MKILPACLPIHGDCLDEMRRMIDEGVQFDACVTDPPYHLLSIVERFGKKDAKPAGAGSDGRFTRAAKGFMGKEWDGGDIAFRVETWELVLQLLKPGGHLLAFNHTTTFHRMAMAIENAGFQIRDQINWLYGSGFPKSLDVEAALLKNGADPEMAAQWRGWGTNLKPCGEPICMARKPLIGTMAKNVAAHGVGALNIDACRVPAEKETGWCGNGSNGYDGGLHKNSEARPVQGRWPGNVVHDGSADVLDAFSYYGPAGSGGGVKGTEPSRTGDSGIYGSYGRVGWVPYADEGNAARFFYSAKADASERVFHCTGSAEVPNSGCGHRVAREAMKTCPRCGGGMEGHPTVKPLDLMAWLCRLVTPPGGHILDPFGGSGSTGIAAVREGFNATLIEKEEESFKDIQHRLKHIKGTDTPLFSALDDAQGTLL